MSDHWTMAFEYRTMEGALLAWNRASSEIEDLIGTGHTSAYRLVVQGKILVVVIGENPLSDQLREIIRDICVDGEETTLVREVGDQLMQRRQTFQIPKGGFRERHFRSL